MMLIFLTSVLLLTIHHGQCSMQAQADLRFDLTSNSIGTLYFVQDNANSPVKITGTLKGLNASSSHGFHVHERPVSETTPNCTAALNHFNPYNTAHGPRDADIMHRHVGDLGNILTDSNGTVSITIQDSIIQFYNSTQSIANLTIIVHLMTDDGGTGNGSSNLTGNAGARVACGLIKLTSSDGLNIKPAVSVLFLTMLLAFITIFY